MAFSVEDFVGKKPVKEQAEFFVDGKRASLCDVAEGTNSTWKSYLETHLLHHSESANRYLTAKLGEYFSARKIHSIAGIRIATLDKWRKQGILQSEQLKGRWYYSIRDLTAAIQSASADDLK